MTVELGLSADEEAIRELFAGLFAREAPITVTRAAEPLGFDAALWDRLRDVEAPGLLVPAARGGSDAGLGAAAVVAGELGRAIAPAPLVEHLVAARHHPEPDVVDGLALATLSLRPADAEGRWRLVPAGAVADVVVGIDHGDLVAVRSPAPGAGPRNHADAPLADRSARDGDRTVIGGAADFERARAEWKTLTAAALVGVAAAALERGVEYAMTRHQFGVPIGSFQAVQHGLADGPGLIDGARLLAHKAAWAGDRGDPGRCEVDDNDVTDFLALASMAFVFAGDAAAHVTDRSLHYHGGYGFAEEYDIQLYYRRARGWALVLGDPALECRALADRLFGPVGAA